MLYRSTGHEAGSDRKASPGRAALLRAGSAEADHFLKQYSQIFLSPPPNNHQHFNSISWQFYVLLSILNVSCSSVTLLYYMITAMEYDAVERNSIGGSRHQKKIPSNSKADRYISPSNLIERYQVNERKIKNDLNTSDCVTPIFISILLLQNVLQLTNMSQQPHFNKVKTVHVYILKHDSGILKAEYL